MTEPRIASLLPSATEIVCALGFQDQLVGRSHECDFPAGVESLPALTAPRFAATPDSAEIDRRVREFAQAARDANEADALGVYAIDTELLRELRPTHIVTQTQCEVCAVSLSDVERAVATITGIESRIVSLAPNSLGDMWDDIQRTADALGRSDLGRVAVESYRRRITEISEQTPRSATPPSVAVVEWADPLMTAGHWTMELIELAAGRPVIGTPRGESLHFSIDDLEAADPDIIIVAPCGYGLPQTRRDAQLLRANPRWTALRAVREGRVALIDGNQYVNRPGPRVVETLEIIAEILHPGRFDFGHRGRAWESEGVAEACVRSTRRTGPQSTPTPSAAGSQPRSTRPSVALTRSPQCPTASATSRTPCSRSTASPT